MSASPHTFSIYVLSSFQFQKPCELGLSDCHQRQTYHFSQKRVAKLWHCLVDSSNKLTGHSPSCTDAQIQNSKAAKKHSVLSGWASQQQSACDKNQRTRCMAGSNNGIQHDRHLSSEGLPCKIMKGSFPSGNPPPRMGEANAANKTQEHTHKM